MIYNPLISELTAVSADRLLRTADEQTHADMTVMYGGSSVYGIIKGEVEGMGTAAAYKWINMTTKASGIGALQLLADVMHKSLYGTDLYDVCREVARRAKIEIPILRRFDYREAVTAIDRMEIGPKHDVFTQQELESLGCTVVFTISGKVAIPHYGFDACWKSEWHFSDNQITEDFRIYPIEYIVMPAGYDPQMVDKSIKIYSTPWSPLFVAYGGDSWGCIFAPFALHTDAGGYHTDAVPIPFVFDTEEPSLRTVQNRLGGDNVFIKSAYYHRDTTDTGVSRAVSELSPDEVLSDTHTEWHPVENGNAESREERIDEKQRKADHVIFCDSPQDAVATYYHLKAAKYDNKYEGHLPSTYHVAFSYNGGHHVHGGDKFRFSKVQYSKLRRFAWNIYTLFPSRRSDTMYARSIGERQSDVRRASLPATIHDITYLKYERICMRRVCTVRDFFLSYRMSEQQEDTFDGQLNLLFKSGITSALCSNPFIRDNKRGKSSKTDPEWEVRDTYYVINPATIWEFMASKGFARAVEEGSTDKIGRYVHIDNASPFVDEYDAPSMVKAVIDCLEQYASTHAWDAIEHDYEKMITATARATKEVNLLTISRLPSVHLDYTKGYGPDIDHFFFKNGALRITKGSLDFIPYSEITFTVDKGEQLPWKFDPEWLSPKCRPYDINENPEYQRKLADIDTKRKEKDADGRAAYTLHQISIMEQQLAKWAQTHRWIVNWKDKQEPDLWPCLRIMRGFANEDWQEEESCLREGKSLPKEKQEELDSHFANLMFCGGSTLWRYRSRNSNCIAYLTENRTENDQKAQGGSGKSTFVNTFLACCGNVLNVNGKNLIPGRDFTLALSEYQHHHHRIIHWEDLANKVSLEQFYNYATGGFSYSKKFVNQVTIPISESPGHVISSNYPVTDSDDSTMRRLCLGFFSHRFSGGNILTNKVRRDFSSIMPDFALGSPERMRQQTRDQIIVCLAIATQFAMRYDVKVDAPQKDYETRDLIAKTSEPFVRWANEFFDQEWIYGGNPVDMEGEMRRFVDEFTDNSERRKQDYSMARFRQKVDYYCRVKGILINPDHLKEGKSNKIWFSAKTWCAVRHFTDDVWKMDASVRQGITVREHRLSRYVAVFYRVGIDTPQCEYDELRRQWQSFMDGPDPAPLLDESGEIIHLTADEMRRERNYTDRKTGNFYSSSASATAAPVEEAAQTDKKDDDLPF